MKPLLVIHKQNPSKEKYFMNLEDIESGNQRFQEKAVYYYEKSKGNI